MLDSGRFPRAARYLASLPSGLASYPECRAKTDFSHVVLGDYPKLLEEARLPEELRRHFDLGAPGQMMPECTAITLRLILRDLQFAGDEPYLAWTYEASARVFRSGVYRMLMYVMSPSLVIMGAAKRWSAFRVGTTLSAKADKKSAQLELTYPPRLYPELVLLGHAQSFRAAVDAAGAADSKVELTGHSETVAGFRVSWQ